jgi:hypothetical protein
MIMFALSGRIQDLSGLRVSPAVENTLSEGVDDAWTQRYFSARADNTGNVSLFFHYQRLALSLVGMGGRLL